jgi:Holliday junction resolvase
MTHPNKAKGNKFEVELVHDAQEKGLEAKRAWGSNGIAIGEAEEVDVLVEKTRIQAKRRKKLPKWLAINEGVDAVVFREDKGETYILMRWEKVLKKMATAKRRRSG